MTNFSANPRAVAPKHIFLEAILIREAELPETLQAAIERKLKEEQASLEDEFELACKRQEAERIIIEAKAKAEANRIVRSSLKIKSCKTRIWEATGKPHPKGLYNALNRALSPGMPFRLKSPLNFNVSEDPKRSSLTTSDTKISSVSASARILEQR